MTFYDIKVAVLKQIFPNWALAIRPYYLFQMPERESSSIYKKET